VAITRARSELVISFSRLNAKRKPQSPAMFITELAEQVNGPQIEQQQLEIDQLLELVPLRLGSTTGGEPPVVFEREAIAELLANYRLSVSGFSRYLDCPLSFFYETVLRVPSFQREQAVFGDALHEALEDYFLRMRADQVKVFPGVSELNYYFELAMEKRRARFEPKQYTDRLRQGKRELATYFKNYRKTWTTDTRVEQKIRNAEINGVPLSGAIDRVDILSDTSVAIWDYKSGTHTDARLRAPTEKNPHGGSYWRQLIFYKILYENRPGFQRSVSESGISFLVMDSDGQQPTVNVPMTQENVDAMTTMITDAWEKIQAQEFTGCGKPECRWCAFASDNLTETPAVSEEIELLDDA
jgi:DNA helicase-2/ATP-dependent DNA helicase PcrA